MKIEKNIPKETLANIYHVIDLISIHDKSIERRIREEGFSSALIETVLSDYLFYIEKDREEYNCNQSYNANDNVCYLGYGNEEG